LPPGFFRRAESRLGYLAVAALFPAVGVPLGVGLLFSREVFSAFVVGMLAVGRGASWVFRLCCSIYSP